MTILSLNLSVSAPPLGPPPALRLWLATESAAKSEPFPPGTVVAAANAANWPSLPKGAVRSSYLPYYNLVRLKLTLEKSSDYDQHFHGWNQFQNRSLDRKKTDNSFKTGTSFHE
ncbi:hypothetical protein Bca52824_023584 [Brassica carinata]|uniref:Uncharacterized protein n=1 Tax=Brassica carinata TaxID=52824 RepID=A0A8X8AVU2_BRACI|nr:hypothetical protein Bca52824_023584 [Brassica carinata]